MHIDKVAKAGTLESNDILVMVMPARAPGVTLELESIVLKQFGPQIREVILNTVAALQVTAVHIKAQDRGALDYAIAARVEAALRRGAQGGTP